MLTIRALVLAGVAVGAFVSPAPACDCISILAREIEGYKAAKHVYVGQVVADDRGVYAVKPLRVYKGAKRSYTLASVSGCGYTLRKGQYILMYAQEDPQTISICDLYPLDVCQAQRDIAVLDRYRRFPIQLVIPGLDCKARTSLDLK